MKYYTDGKARPFSSISIDDLPLEMPEGGPQLFIPLFETRDAFEEHTGEPECYEVELQLEGVSQ